MASSLGTKLQVQAALVGDKPELSSRKPLAWSRRLATRLPVSGVIGMWMQAR